MYPRLIDISTGIQGFSHFTLPSYFSMVTIGFILATVLIYRWAKDNGIDPKLMIDFIIWMALWGVLGSRILHVIADGHFWDYVNVCRDPSLVDWKVDMRECKALQGVWDSAKGVCHPSETNCLAFADVTAGGFAFYGGFIAAALYSVYFFKKHNLPTGKMVDMAGWALMLGVTWGRIGCFLASCCFGARTDCPIGVVFPGRSAASRYHWDQGWLESYRMESLRVHPTQLYEALGVLAIAAFCYFWLRPRKRFHGQVFCTAAGSYAVFRFFIEFIRNDERGSLFGFSTSQLLAIVFLGACAWLWSYFGRQAGRSESA
jgi:phosphatidylglycerol:prolipoprotein diacylglycerol transferase